MITIKVDNSHAKIISNDVGAIKDIDKILSYEVQGAYFAQKVTGRGWDGRVRLMSRAGVFPTGLIHLIMRYLKENNLEYKLVNVRSKPTPSVAYNLKLPFPPRDYQTEALEISKKRARGVFIIGTGGGKSATSAMILASKNVPTLFICPDTGLREQMAKDYRQWFGDHNVSTSINDPRPITVANIQSLVGADGEKFLRYGCLIIDEFHHSGAKTYKLVSNACRNAYYRYGFTGTFMRSDGTDLEMHGVLSAILFKKTTSSLIEEGYLVRPDVTICEYQASMPPCTYQQAYNQIIEDERLSRIIAAIATRHCNENKQVLVLVRRKSHGEIITSMIPGAIYLNGDDESLYRESIKKQFIDKDVHCVVATSIFGEGIDIPSIDVLVNARFEKTEIQTKQGIGRALRKFEGKDKAEVFDFLLRGQKHLESHSKHRIKTYKSEAAFNIIIKKMF